MKKKDSSSELNEIDRLKSEITKRKNAETKARKDRESLLVTLRSIGDGVIATDKNEKIEFMNKVAEKITGWNLQEAKGKDLHEVLKLKKTESEQRIDNLIQKTLEAPKNILASENMTLVCRENKERPIALNSASIESNEGMSSGIVVVFRDILEEQRMEQELHKADKLESIGTLAGGIAHDFNNLLTAILGNISLAKLEVGDNPEVLRLLDEAEQASLRSKNLTQQLLTFSKGGAPIKQITSLGQVVKETVPFVLSGSNVKSQILVADDLWDVEIDIEQIKQVINDIVMNAQHAMPKGGNIQVTVENFEIKDYGEEEEGIPPLPKGRYVRVSLKDYGAGIPKKNLQRIFDPFFTTKQLGSGLGLSTCYSIMRKHHGAITVNSEEGQGATFYLYFPMAGGQSAKVEEKPVSEPVVSKQKRVLIMDDEKAVLNVAGKLLNHLGFDVDYAENGAQAIEKYQNAMNHKKPFNAVLMDLTIPGAMGGKEAIKELRKIDPNIKAIVSSGYSNDPVMSDFQEYGFCARVAKPYQLKELKQILNEVTSS